MKNKSNTSLVVMTIVFGIALTIWAISFEKNKAEVKNDKSKPNPTPLDASPNTSLETRDIENHEAEIGQVEFLSKTLDMRKNKTFETTEDIRLQLNEFESWHNTIDNAELIKDSKLEKVTNSFKSKVRNIQKKEFPKMRLAFGTLKAKELWREDMNISTSGSKNTVVNITHHKFVRNANIEDFNNTIWETLDRLRFKEVRYRWYEGSDKYTFYKINSKMDMDL